MPLVILGVYTKFDVTLNKKIDIFPELDPV